MVSGTVTLVPAKPPLCQPSARPRDEGSSRTLQLASTVGSAGGGAGEPWLAEGWGGGSVGAAGSGAPGEACDADSADPADGFAVATATTAAAHSSTSETASLRSAGGFTCIRTTVAVVQSAAGIAGSA